MITPVVGRAQAFCGCKAADAEGPALVFASQVGNEPLREGRLGRGLVRLSDSSVLVRGRLRCSMQMGLDVSMTNSMAYGCQVSSACAH